MDAIIGLAQGSLRAREARTVRCEVKGKKKTPCDESGKESRTKSKLRDHVGSCYTTTVARTPLQYEDP